MKLIKLLTKIKRSLFGPKTEIEFVEASLNRHRWKLILLQDRLGDIRNYCCYHCASHGEYTRLVEKIERIEHRLNVLKKRKLKKNV